MKAGKTTELYICSSMTFFLRLTWEVVGISYEEPDIYEMGALTLMACRS